MEIKNKNVLLTVYVDTNVYFVCWYVSCGLSTYSRHERLFCLFVGIPLTKYMV